MNSNDVSSSEALQLVSLLTPNPGQVAVPVDTDVSVLFDRTLVSTNSRKTLEDGLFLTDEKSAPVPGKKSWVGEVLHFKPTRALQSGQSYTVRLAKGTELSGIRKLDGDLSWTFRTGATRQERFTLRQSYPASGATFVPTASSVRLDFSHPISSQSANSDSVSVTDAQGVAVRGIVSVANTAVTFKPVGGKFKPDEVYLVALSQKLTSADGIALDAETRFLFETGHGEQSTAPLVVTLTNPVTGASDVAPDSRVSAVFSKPVIEGSVRATPPAASRFSVFDASGAVVPGEFELSGNVVNFRPLSALTRGLSYTAVISKDVEGADGSLLPWDYRWSFAVSSGASPVTSATSLLRSNPSDNELSVRPENPVTLLFSRPVKQVSSSTVSLVRTSDSAAVPATLNALGTQVEIVPMSPLSPSTNYTINVVGVQDDATGDVVAAWSGRFRTASDKAPPKLVSRFPLSGETNVPLNTRVQMIFDEPLLASSIAGAFEAKNGAGTTLTLASGSPSLDASGKVVSIAFVPGVLSPRSLVAIHIKDSVKDLAGNPLPWPETFSFTTGNSVDGIGGWVESRFPASEEFSAAVSSKVIATFSKTMDAASVNSTSFRVRSLPGLVAVAGTTVTLGKSILFTPNVPLAYDVEYDVSFTGLLDANGIALPDAGWRFRTQTDTTPPSLVAFSPSRDLTDVPRDSIVSMIFSKSISAASINATSVQWTDGAGAVVAPAPGYPLVSGNTIHLKAASLLSASTVFRVKLTSALLDTSALPLSVPYEWTYTSAAAVPTPPATAEILIADPPQNALGVTVSSSVSIEFSKALDATTVANTVTLKLVDDAAPGVMLPAIVNTLGSRLVLVPLGTLKANTRYTFSLLAGLKFADASSVTAASWKFHTRPDRDAPTVSQTIPGPDTDNVPLNSTVQVWFNETMDASTLTGANVRLKRASDGTPVAATVTAHSFGASLVPTAALLPFTGYLVEVATAVSDTQGNGLAQLRTWSFTTGAGSSLTPPLVSATSPLRNAGEIPLTQRVEIAFNRMMDVTTFVAANVFVKNDVGGAVAGTVATISPYSVSFTPSASWDYNRRYFVTVTSGAKDILGNALAAEENFTFLTRLSATGDGTLPQVSAYFPANGLTEIDTATDLRALFNVPLDPTTVTAASFLLKNQIGGAVAGTVTVINDNRVARFVPTAALIPGARYTATLTTAIRDTSGSYLPFNQSWSFTAKNTLDRTSPNVTGVGPAPGNRYVPINPVIMWASFSEAIEITSVIADSTIQLTNTTTSTAVPITTSMDPSRTYVYFSPISALTYGHTYRIRITTGVKDAAGNPLLQTIDSTFTTEQLKVSHMATGHHYNFCSIVAGIATGNNAHCWGYLAGNMNEDLIKINSQWKKLGMTAYGMCGIKSNDLVECVGYQYADANIAGSAQAAVTFKELAGTYYGPYCGIKLSDGSLACWGNWDSGNWPAPPAGIGYKRITAGHFFFCAIKSDDTVACWGYTPPVGSGNRNDYGQQTVPTGLTGVKDLVSNHYQTVAVKTDGSLVYWGYSNAGQGTDLVATVDATKTAQVAITYNSYCAITASPAKNVKCAVTGDLSIGDALDPETTNASSPPPSIQGKTIAIYGSTHDFCAVLDNDANGIADDLRCWGHPGYDVNRRYVR